MDEDDPDRSFEVRNRTHNPLSSQFRPEQKKELMSFMKSFVESYGDHTKFPLAGPSEDRNQHKKNRRDQPSNSLTKSLRFPLQRPIQDESHGEKDSHPIPFGCLSDVRHRKGLSKNIESNDNFVNSLRADKGSNKLAEAFLQLAGLSQAESNGFFKKANAKKSGEHRKPSDVAPIEVRWPQEMLDRPKGLEVGYNDLGLAEFFSGNLAILEFGLPQNDFYDLIRGQVNYFRNLCDDVVDFGWPLVREVHKAVLLSLEKGALDPNDFIGMHDRRKICLDRAFRHQKSPDQPQSSGSSSASGSARNTGSERSNPGMHLRVCKHYNEGKCNFPKEHAKGAYLWTHICSFCWHKLKQKRNHMEMECEIKKKDSTPKQVKNEKGWN